MNESIIAHYMASKRNYLLAQSDGQMTSEQLDRAIHQDLQNILSLFSGVVADWDLELYLTDQIRIYDGMAEMYAPEMRAKFRYVPNKEKRRFLP
jgi:hypothetical protein